MIEDKDQDYEILSKGTLVMLRAIIKTDRKYYDRWQTQGEWRSFDAPWEQIKLNENQNQDESKKQTDIQKDTTPKKYAVIATLENKPLGWINRYGDKDNPFVWFVGLDICEDNYLNHGYGTEALTLWVDYLFENSYYHKLCLDTWSFNPRMMRVAEKIGFIYEGFQRDMRFWQGEWLHLMHFGMLRDEWESRR